MKINKNINTYLDKIKELPTLPTIYSTFMDVVSNPRSTAQDVADVISQDQSAASKILKISNSSIYGFYGRISSITQAVSFIGFEEVKNLIISISIMKIFKDSKQIGAFNPVNLWKHSIFTAVATRIIGKSSGERKIEEFFVAGILHQIGKLILYKIDPESYIKTIEYARYNNILCKDAEQEILGITYTVIGEMIAEKWNLPASVRNAIRYHHIGLYEGEKNKMVAAIHIAKILGLIMKINSYENELVPKPNAAVWEILELPENFFEINLEYIMQSYYESETLLLKN
jgi:HD-like signal output (HDOD) protein